MGQTPSTFPVLTPRTPLSRFIIALSSPISSSPSSPIVVLIALHPPVKPIHKRRTACMTCLQSPTLVVCRASDVFKWPGWQIRGWRLPAGDSCPVLRFISCSCSVQLGCSSLQFSFRECFCFADPGPPEMCRQWPGDAPEVSRCASWCFVDPPTRPGTTCRMFISTPCAVDLLISQLVSSCSRSWLNGRRPPSLCIAEVPVAAATAARRLGSFRSWRRSGVAHSLGGLILARQTYVNAGYRCLHPPWLKYSVGQGVGPKFEFVWGTQVVDIWHIGPGTLPMGNEEPPLIQRPPQAWHGHAAWGMYTGLTPQVVENSEAWAKPRRRQPGQPSRRQTKRQPNVEQPGPPIQ